MQKKDTLQLDGFWLTTAAAVIWGTIGIATQAIFNAEPNTTGLFINLARMLVALPVMAFACWRAIGRDMFQVPRRDLGIMLLHGAFLAVSQAAYFAGIQAAGVTIATLLTVCSAPVIVTTFSVLMKTETLTGRTLVALACAVTGAALLVGLDVPEGDRAGLLTGAFFAMISAVTYAGAILCGRFLAGGYHPMQVTTITFGAGAVVLVVFNLLAGFVAVQTVSGWLLIAYLGVVPTALAYWLFQRGLRTVSATAASIITMLEPVVAALLAWWLFGETLPPTGFIGSVLMMLSIFLLSTRRRESPRLPNPEKASA
ncbi:MAG: EamA family transporter [Pleurocapsa minor GSE-CHR-MK-17-07R]|jgi:DME family drug/metabolite transporter|nr:EamA family transporter [Pleurocapsa minor GSE-CHR-MK 17-07R]